LTIFGFFDIFGQINKSERMDHRFNPYNPGAGTPPPELAGREAVISAVRTAIERAKNGRPAANHILTGLRGVGKTVLLVEFEKLAETLCCYPTTVAEADGKKGLPKIILSQLFRIIVKLDKLKKAEQEMHKGLQMLRSIASAFSVKIGGAEIGVSPAEATGDLAVDLSDLFMEIGNAAKQKNTVVVILLDEIQCLSEDDFSSLIIALHKVSQRQLPVIFIGAGLPQLPKLAGDAKSYAERMFRYTKIGRLEDEDAIKAIVEPAAVEDVEFTDDALKLILTETEGYPYYLQLWGSEAWKAALSSPIEAEDIQSATVSAIAELDNGIFATRLQRLTDRQQEYARAMADVGVPATSSHVAGRLGLTSEQAAPMRDELIKKGMAYSPQRGLVDFTIPLFDAFMRRQKDRSLTSGRGPKKRKRQPKTMFD
jgi:hypothetical protein